MQSIGGWSPPCQPVGDQLLLIPTDYSDYLLLDTHLSFSLQGLEILIYNCLYIIQNNILSSTIFISILIHSSHYNNGMLYLKINHKWLTDWHSKCQEHHEQLLVYILAIFGYIFPVLAFKKKKWGKLDYIWNNINIVEYNIWWQRDSRWIWLWKNLPEAWIY